MEDRPRHIGHRAQSDPTDPRTILLCCDNDNCLFLRSSTTDTLVCRTAHIDFVHLDDTIQAIPSWSHHGSPQLMQPSPGSLITAESQHSLQPKRTDAVFLARNKPHTQKPGAQWLSGSLEDRSCRHRRLALAFSAVKETTGCAPRSRSRLTQRFLKWEFS